MRVISSGPLVPGPWSRTISYAHNLPNRGIAHQFPEFLSGQGLRRVAVGIYGTQEAERCGAGVHELMRHIRGNIHEVEWSHVEHLAAHNYPSGAVENDDRVDVPVFLQTRVAAWLDLKVPQLKRHRLTRAAGQRMPDHIPPRGTGHR